MIVVFSAFASLKYEVSASEGEPGISVGSILTLGNETDIWSVHLNNGTNLENFSIYGTQSDPVVSNLSSQVLATASYQENGNTIVQQDILLGFKYSWNYTLEISSPSKIDVIAFNLGVRFPVRVQLQCPENMTRGSVYQLNATLTPLDWPNFDEFVCYFKVFGQSIFDRSQSITTPLGPENAWTPFEIGPIIIWPEIPFVLCNLDLGFVIVPRLFSQKIEATVNVSGDSNLIGSDKIVWTAPEQTAQFNVKADNSTGLNYSSIVLSQFHFFLDSLLVDFKAYLQANWWWGGSSSVSFTLFTVDASKLLPSLSFGAISPYTEIEANILVTGAFTENNTKTLTMLPAIGSGTTDPASLGNYRYVSGTHVNVTSYPAGGWRMAYLNETNNGPSVSSGINPVMIHLDKDINAYVKFTPTTLPFTDNMETANWTWMNKWDWSASAGQSVTQKHSGVYSVYVGTTAPTDSLKKFVNPIVMNNCSAYFYFTTYPSSNGTAPYMDDVTVMSVGSSSGSLTYLKLVMHQYGSGWNYSYYFRNQFDNQWDGPVSLNAVTLNTWIGWRFEYDVDGSIWILKDSGAGWTYIKSVGAKQTLPTYCQFGADSFVTGLHNYYIDDVSITDAALPTYRLMVVPEIGNGEVLVNGTTALTHVNGHHVGGGILFTEGDTANLTAVPALGWKFNDWGFGLGTSNPLYLTMTGNKSAWAFFTENSTRTLTMLPSTGGTTLPQAETWGYVNMSLVTLYAYPSANFQFYRGAINYQVGSVNMTEYQYYQTYSLNMTRDYNVTAEFQQQPSVTPPPPTPTPTSTSSPTPTPMPTKPIPNLAVSCRSSTTYSNFKVEISGSLTANGTGLQGVPVLLSYSVNGGNSWNDLTLVNTDSSGNYSAIWTTSVTGNYLLRAVYSGNQTYAQTSITVNLAVTPFEEQSVFSVSSNSTISAFAFNSTSNELSFRVSGESGTTGYVDVFIPKSLMNDVSNLKVYLDGNILTSTTESQGDSWLVSFTYHLSTHEVTMYLGSAQSTSSTESQLGVYAIVGVIITAIATVAVMLVLRKQRKVKSGT